MLNNMLVVKILSGLVLGAVAMWARRRDSREAERAFSSLSVKSLDPRLCLEGATAKIVLNRVASDSRTPYSLFRICKNEHGEYFLYMYNGAPYVTHLSRERARNAMSIDQKAYEREFGEAKGDAVSGDR
jgi:hypothetical protein